MKIHNIVIAFVLLSLATSVSLFAAETLPTNTKVDKFAVYREVPTKLPDTYNGYTLPIKKADIGNLKKLDLSKAQVELLLKNGFFVKPAEWKEFFPLYNEIQYGDVPAFVTTDSILHAYHLLFDKMLRDLEKEHLSPDITKLTHGCRKEAERLYNELKGTELEDASRRVLAYFSVAENLIAPGSRIPPDVADMVGGELALIDKHSGIRNSVVIKGLIEDYSQYVPRGHYTKSDLLKRYFRTMMWYGRINFRLMSPEETKMALLITYILRNTVIDGVSASEIWERVYGPTTFIVGKSDDLSFIEYGGLWDKVFGKDATPQAMTDKKLVKAFIEAARNLPPPQINSMWVYIWEDEDEVTQGFRFMGSRFVIDSYIFEQLVWREVGTMDNPRWLPSGLDVMGVLGSGEAYSILEEAGETAFLNYPEKFEKVKGEISALGMDSWTQNLYWVWIYTLKSEVSPKDESYPAFMRTKAWMRKDLNSALGSWTELKHDTILYAKQVMAEMGGGFDEIPRGWVEPQPEVYARLLALTRMTKNGLESRGILSGKTGDNLSQLDNILSFLHRVSQKELLGESLTQEEYERILYYGGSLEHLTLSAADTEGEWSDYFEKIDAAVVADVATDPNGFVLEEATGRIFEIYVVIPDGLGGLSIARGGVFSYYEFQWPMGDRLTDEAWREKLNIGDIPDRPKWTDIYFAE